jgi:acetyl-CoA C-acetyltransferase
MTDIVIASAARTPVGSFNGAFASVPAHELGAIAIQAALSRAGVEPGEVDEVILGQILTAAAGQNPARQASVAAGIPVEKHRLRHQPALRLRPAGGGAGGAADRHGRRHHRRRRRPGEHEPGAARAEPAQRPEDGHLEFIDTMMKDGLWDAFHGYHMGNTAENVAQKYQLTRGEQDEFAANSQRKAGEAMAAGRFKDEIATVTVKGRKGDTVDQR